MDKKKIVMHFGAYPTYDESRKNQDKKHKLLLYEISYLIYRDTHEGHQRSTKTLT